ncbi:uncharacterized protein LOC126212834 [Schistocerca nitens]|uniref:uncharacterized protein LOC126212834 n=1 Tax=Schistocerca nitens TaxID=7011 RepID=UPI002118C3A7|nr:uncharacterized protein LOC126212834 [Schistocerca nitens]XP_049796207.1 uncharacterized protein LOC126212834 [Schistocerca nitens]XP_049796208.1 uncharacterized protein LOC126212834 [Schistocerca nitens]XP_049796209.1 uncharacterized protein LOC126212834 [Schistocerca nitens]
MLQMLQLQQQQQQQQQPAAVATAKPTVPTFLAFNEETEDWETCLQQLKHHFLAHHVPDMIAVGLWLTMQPTPSHTADTTPLSGGTIAVDSPAPPQRLMRTSSPLASPSLPSWAPSPDVHPMEVDVIM